MIEAQAAVCSRGGPVHTVWHRKDYRQIEDRLAAHGVTMLPKDFRQSIQSMRLPRWPGSPIITFQNEDRKAKDGLAPEPLQVAPVVMQDRCRGNRPKQHREKSDRHRPLTRLCEQGSRPRAVPGRQAQFVLSRACGLVQR